MLLVLMILFNPGGLASVIYTDTLQTVILIIGATTVTVMGEIQDFSIIIFRLVKNFITNNSFMLLLIELALIWIIDISKSNMTLYFF